MKDKQMLRWSDAWLLLSIYYAQSHEHSCLSSIIAAADYINHAVMNYEELTSGLVRLESSGMIIISRDFSEVICSSKTNDIIKPIIKKNGFAHDARKELERNINALPWVPKEPIPHPENNCECPGLTRSMYLSAVNEYLMSMKRREKRSVRKNDNHRQRS